MTTSVLDCRAVLFDLDGVLVDSTESVRGVLVEWASPRGVDHDELLQASHGRRFADALRLVAPHLDAIAEAGLLESMVASASPGVTPIRGAQALVDGLPRDAWAVVTSASTRVAKAGHRAGMPVIAVTTHRGAELPTPWIVTDLGGLHVEHGVANSGAAVLRLHVTGDPGN